jgi:hypothetical protein
LSKDVLTGWLPEAYDHGVFGAIEQETFMQHMSRIEEANVGAVPKIIAALVVILGLAAVGAFVVYGSGMWNPAPAKTAY